MPAKRWLQEQEPKWQRLETLLAQTQRSMASLTPEEIREMGMLYRETVNDLSRAQTTAQYQHLEP
jgi:hypothetical protein